MEEVDILRKKADLAGERAASIEDQLMEPIDRPFIKRHELEIQLYSFRLEQAKYNLKWQQAQKYLRECRADN